MTCTRRQISLAVAGCGLAGGGQPAARIVVGPGRMLRFGDLLAPCAVGRNGVTRNKAEGDGATPAGAFPLRRLLYRPDRVARVATGLPMRALRPEDAWCDDPGAPEYNTLVRAPFGRRTETLWRDDTLYDVIIVIGYNDDPVIPGRGSAIFLHVAREGLTGTEGCVAVALATLLQVARLCTPATVIDIAAP
jgi:L,D-peptidoglycan transpeptidase YkuD (ErfK/YbiS/YcfS/YnhG family)